MTEWGCKDGENELSAGAIDVTQADTFSSTNFHANFHLTLTTLELNGNFLSLWIARHQRSHSGEWTQIS